MSLHVVVNASIEGTYKKSTDLGESSYAIAKSDPIVLKDGTGDGRADIYFDDERTLAASANETLDLAGALADIFGQTVAAAKVKAIEIEADAGNANNVEIGGAASNAFVGFFGDATDKIVLAPGDRFVVASAAGRTVTAGTGDLLKIANGGAGSSVTYRIKVVAASA